MINDIAALEAGWEKISRRFSDDMPFWACVDKEGNWFDSSHRFEVAVHWCCEYIAEWGLEPEEELKLYYSHQCSGCMVVPSYMLKQLYFSGFLQ